MPAPPYLTASRQAVAACTTATATARMFHHKSRSSLLAGGPIPGFTGHTDAPVTRAPGSRTMSYKYPFPSIPRPRRNLLYYYNPMATIKRGLMSLPESGAGILVQQSSRWPSWPRFIRRSSSSAGLLGTRNASFPGYGTFARLRGHRKMSTGQAQVSGRKKWRWWAVPAVTTVILWGVLRRRREKEVSEGQPAVAKPAKPWQVAAYSTLPLKAMSRLWGRVNDITLPMWMREPGFKFYSYMFGANLQEVAEEDLTKYANLGEFFYRELKPGVRPIDPDAVLVSPADGKVLHLGVINDRKVEQVKGITYSLDALLGGGPDHSLAAPSHEVDFELHDQDEIFERHKEFAIMNGISYTLDELIGDEQHQNTEIKDQGDATLMSVNSSTSSFANVSKDLLMPDFTPSNEKELFFAVIYLAPGDYHRFHSPANWVTDLRRHFAGELYSVAPYFQSRLQGLFCLNERVALLGRWRYGFFSMTPVGATNVGSIRVHFDKDLQTNTVYERENVSSDSVSSIDSASTSLSSSSTKRKKVQKSTCYEATYAKASRLLGGYPLSKGDQMGGFNLGSTVVLVFEAPKSFHFKVKAGERVKVGQALGSIP
jgi:phosphatidylserine decarboxylase